MWTGTADSGPPLNAWTLDLLIEGAYATEQAVDPAGGADAGEGAGAGVGVRALVSGFLPSVVCGFYPRVAQ